MPEFNEQCLRNTHEVLKIIADWEAASPDGLTGRHQCIIEIHNVFVRFANKLNGFDGVVDGA